jgi:hypothetical protein
VLSVIHDAQGPEADSVGLITTPILRDVYEIGRSRRDFAVPTGDSEAGLRSAAGTGVSLAASRQVTSSAVPAERAGFLAACDGQPRPASGCALGGAVAPLSMQPVSAAGCPMSAQCHPGRRAVAAVTPPNGTDNQCGQPTTSLSVQSSMPPIITSGEEPSSGRAADHQDGQSRLPNPGPGHGGSSILPPASPG